MEAHHRGGWATAVARELRLSEYTLHGIFAEEVLGLDAAGQFPWDDPILNLCWDEPMGCRTEIDKLLEHTDDAHIGAMFHSKAGFHPAHLRPRWRRGGPTTAAERPVRSRWGSCDRLAGDARPDARPRKHHSGASGGRIDETRHRNPKEMV